MADRRVEYQVVGVEDESQNIGSVDDVQQILEQYGSNGWSLVDISFDQWGRIRFLIFER